MVQVSRHPVTPLIEKRISEIFIDSLKTNKTSSDAVTFINDLLTPTEQIMLAKRLSVALLLLRGDYTYDQISKLLRVSDGTIAKINAVIALKGNGYRKIMKRVMRKKAIKEIFEELIEGLTPIPPKGANWSEWQKSRRKRRLKRQEPL